MSFVCEKLKKFITMVFSIILGEKKKYRCSASTLHKNQQVSSQSIVDPRFPRYFTFIEARSSLDGVTYLHDECHLFIFVKGAIDLILICRYFRFQ